ncbi:hypothetical protein CDAR_455471 [Caerostris darwini]|uniref:C2H2-type domain-containing protein n=1 Tax=Caerostris darwini TaxID=1538125 RepID=A0AAV4TKH5_9ARAC|nr:hypothetical protein CDAR_455471 [Caerostris darwini]
MEISNCQFCNAYIANFEVHNCVTFGNQHRQSSATLRHSSSDIRAQDIDSVSAQQTHYEAQWPFFSQSNFSTQQSFLPDVHQRIYWGETAAAETFSQHAVTNQNLYNPETSDFLFPDWPHDQERQFGSTHLQHPSEANYLITNQNPHCCEDFNPEHSANAPMPVAEPYFLPGFQQTFGQRHALTHQMAHPPNASCQMECSGISRTDEMSPHFITDFNENFDASANRSSPQYETSSGIPILTVPNNPLDPIPPTDAKGPIHSDKCPEEFLARDHLEPHDRSGSVARPHACNYCGRTFSLRGNLTRHIRTHTGEKPYKCTVCNQCFANNSNLRRHMDIHTGGSYKCTECSKRFSQSSILHEHVHAFHSGENPNKCEECGKYFATPITLRRHISSVHTADKPYKCTKCGQCFARRDKLREHVRRMHTDG